MKRYWQRADGTIFTTDTVSTYPGRVGYTEVRIVPADAIVVERSELPAVEFTASGNPMAAASIAGGPQCGAPHIARRDMDPVAIRSQAYAHLALAEYLDANPPVDSAEVDRVMGAIAKVGLIGKTGDEIARGLVAAGVRVVTS